jgi:acetyl-CoA carboxylase biotin carboxylase subunit
MVPPYYDSMIAKLIAWGETRIEAIETMEKGLRVCALEGVKTNEALHKAIMADPRFREGGVDTNYLAGILPGIAKRESSK